MLNFINTKTGLDIEYTKGDSFIFEISAESEVSDGTQLRLQISANGDTDNVDISKTFNATNNSFTVELAESDLNQFAPGDIHQYRLTIFDISGNITTTISGNLIVKWGA